MTPSDWYYSNFKPRPETEIAKTPNFWLKQGKLFFFLKIEHQKAM